MPYRGPCKICLTNNYNNLLFIHEWKDPNGFGSRYGHFISTSLPPTAG